DKVNLYRVTDKRGDLLSVFFDDTGEAHMAVAYAVGYDIYLNRADYPNEFREFEQLVNRFLWEYYRQYYQDFVKEKEKLIKETERQIKRAERNVKQEQRAIRKAEKSHQKALRKNPDAPYDAVGIALDNHRAEITRQEALKRQLEDELRVYEADRQRGELRLIEVRSRLN
ncbi:MAG: hypothetical protein WBA12_11410, partial [Catalinimonas sp.]